MPATSVSPLARLRKGWAVGMRTLSAMVKENRTILLAPRQPSNDGSSTRGSPRLFWLYMAEPQIRAPGSFSKFVPAAIVAVTCRNYAFEMWLRLRSLRRRDCCRPALNKFSNANRPLPRVRTFHWALLSSLEGVQAVRDNQAKSFSLTQSQ
jgi:hypothetical protein